MKRSPAYSCAVLLTSDYKHYTGHLYCLDVIWWIFSTRIQKIDYAILQILPSLRPTIHYMATNTNKKQPHRVPTTLKSEGEVTSLSGADKREVRDNREKSKYFSNCTTFHIRGALSWHSYVIMYLLCIKVYSIVV